MTPRTTRPDNGAYPSKIVSSDVDLGEVAARLGGDRLRRSGRVICLDEFSTLGGWTPTIPLNSIVDCYTEYEVNLPFNGPGMLVMYSPNAGINPSVFHFIPTMSESTCGLETTIRIAGATGYATSLLWTLRRVAETNSWRGIIRLDLTTSPWELSYLTSGGIYTKFADLAENNVWINYKLVVDFLNGKYKYFQVNNITHDLSANGLHNQSGTGAYTQHATIDLNGIAGATHGILIDNAIITVDDY